MAHEWLAAQLIDTSAGTLLTCATHSRRSLFQCCLPNSVYALLGGFGAPQVYARLTEKCVAIFV